MRNVTVSLQLRCKSHTEADMFNNMSVFFLPFALSSHSKINRLVAKLCVCVYYIYIKVLNLATSFKTFNIPKKETKSNRELETMMKDPL